VPMKPNASIAACQVAFASGLIEILIRGPEALPWIGPTA